MKRQARQSGFTLLELVLVMLIAMTAVGMAAAKLTGWSRGAKLRNSADELLKITRYGRTQSITEGTKYRIEFNSNAGVYQLRRWDNAGAQLVDIPSDLGRIYRAPDGGRIELTVVSDGRLKAEGDYAEVIDFYPTGRTQAATVRISDGKGFEIEISCASPTEDFRVSYEGKTRS